MDELLAKRRKILERLEMKAKKEKEKMRLMEEREKEEKRIAEGGRPKGHVLSLPGEAKTPLFVKVLRPRGRPAKNAEQKDVILQVCPALNSLSSPAPFLSLNGVLYHPVSASSLSPAQNAAANEVRVLPELPEDIEENEESSMEMSDEEESDDDENNDFEVNDVYGEEELEKSNLSTKIGRENDNDSHDDSDDNLDNDLDDDLDVKEEKDNETQGTRDNELESKENVFLEKLI